MKLVALAFLSVVIADPLPADLTGTTVDIIETTGDANQGVGVDEDYYYAVTNRRITKIDKWDGEADFEDGHFDSGEVQGNLLYCSNSNWPQWPMASSIEIFDTATMEHVGTHSIGIDKGSFTWLSFNPADGYWYGTFANYDRYQRGAMDSYGKKYNTQICRLKQDTYEITNCYEIPANVRETFEIMSNSGGSWGPDGYLYITGHDLPQAYVMELPKIGHIMHLVAVVDVPDIAGQGIAWDHWADCPTLVGIYRPDKTVIITEMPTKEEVMAVARPQGTGTVHDNVADFHT